MNAPDEITSEEKKIILEEWKTVIQTQMHFNDMIMKIRTAGISLLVTLFGAAAYSLQYNEVGLQICGSFIHGSIFIVIFGLTFMSGILILDYFYYFKMLIGAVKRGYEIYESYGDRMIKGVKMFGMTSLIRDEIGRPGSSKYIIFSFYGITFLMGILFICLISHGYV